MKTRIIPKDQDAAFHVVSRIAFQLMNLGQQEKRVFRDLLAKQATFSGVQVLSYCLLDNHFHILLKIPHQKEISDKELLKRYTALYKDSDPRHTMPPEELKKCLEAGGQAAKNTRKRLISRMGNLSIFMKELKQRFTIWYNRRHQNAGTLWEKRFDSILVENTKKTLQLMAAYIDLNPVRLRLCKNPKDYAFCTFGEACKGNATARQWLTHLFHPAQWNKTLRQYESLHSDNHDTLQNRMLSIKGMKTGIIGTDKFVRNWSPQTHKTQNTKRSIPSLILEGVLYAGACALSARQDFTRHSSMP